VRTWLLVLLLLPAVALAQSDVPPDSALLQEVKALRAEIKNVAGASLIAQVIIGRLQIHQTRVADAQRNLASIQNQITVNRQLRTQLAAQRPTDPPTEAMLKRQVQHMDNEFERLLEREAQAELAETSEEAAWSDLNARLDQLEYALPK
jgi:hypothetical protein